MHRSSNRTSWRAKAACVAITAALIAVSCGGDDADSTETTAGTETTTGTATSPGPDTTAAGEDVTPPAGEPFRIGVIGDTSGAAAPTSTVTQQGLELAVEDINAAGGLDGRPIELVNESDGSDATQTPVLLRKLADQGVAAIMITTGSASAAGVKPLCAELALVCIHPTSPSVDLPAPPGNEYMFTLPPTALDMVKAYVGALDAIGAKSVAILEDNTPTIAGINDAIQKGLEAAGIEVVAREAVALNAVDASAEVARAAAKSPDAVVVSSLGGQTEISIANALHEQMPDTPKIGKTSIPNQPQTWALADPGALSGMIYIQTIDLTNPRTAELAPRLKEKVGGDFIAMTDFYAQGYDAVFLLAQAYQSNSDDLRAGLEQISGYQPHYGQEPLTLSFSADKHSATDNLCALVIRVFNDDNVLGDRWDEYQPTC